MVLTPEKVYEELSNNKLNKSRAYDLLISLVENSENEEIREDSIKYLEKVGVFNDKLYDFLENILISDSNTAVRIKAAKFLRKKFLEKSFKPFKWVIDHEKDCECTIIAIKSLKKIHSSETKLLLFNQIKSIIKTRYINKHKKIENKKYRRIVKKLIKSKKYENFTHKELSDILINYIIIKNLIKRYPNVYYELNPQTGLIEQLDLSDFLEYEVKGTPYGWKNNITSISEIYGLKYLKNIKKIDLSNNKIEDVKDLNKLENLTHLILTNNEISELENIEIIKSLPNLAYLDLRDNDIIKKISIKDFDEKNIRVILKDYLILK